MFVPVKVSVPDPFLVNEPAPPMTPLKVELAPASAENVPPTGIQGDRFARSDPAPSRQGFQCAVVKAQGPSPQVTVAVYCEDTSVDVCTAAIGVSTSQRQRA